MNIYELLFVRPELRITRRLENPQYLPSIKATYTKLEDYEEWLKNQLVRIEADLQIATTIGISSRVEKISAAREVLKKEMDSLHTEML